jgi:hypothetical protein
MIRELTTSTRADEVIRLLAAHEALSFGALKALLVPEISEKRLRRVVSALVNEGVIRRRLFHLSGGKAVFFELADPLRSDRGIGSVHNSLLIHNDLCAFTVETLQRMLPEAICVREYAIPRSATLRGVMKYQEKSRDSLPDILLALPAETGGQPAFIAVEIERSVKSSKRLLKKFTKYASQTRLDGVLYLSDDDRVLSVLRQRYREQAAGRARRVGHYRDLFFLTASCPSKQFLGFKNPFNLANAPVSLEAWMRFLSGVPLLERQIGSSLGWGGALPEARATSVAEKRTNSSGDHHRPPLLKPSSLPDPSPPTSV